MSYFRAPCSYRFSFYRLYGISGTRKGYMSEPVDLIECPRDAWQGLQETIPADYKAEYLKELTFAGFKHIDAVSFVSPRHVKQMADSEEVMQTFRASLPEGTEPPEIIGIVVNEKGLERALATPGV